MTLQPAALRLAHQAVASTTRFQKILIFFVPVIRLESVWQPVYSYSETALYWHSPDGAIICCSQWLLLDFGSIYPLCTLIEPCCGRARIQLAAVSVCVSSFARAAWNINGLRRSVLLCQSRDHSAEKLLVLLRLYFFATSMSLKTKNDDFRTYWECGRNIFRYAHISNVTFATF